MRAGWRTRDDAGAALGLFRMRRACWLDQGERPLFSKGHAAIDLTRCVYVDALVYHCHSETRVVRISRFAAAALTTLTVASSFNETLADALKVGLLLVERGVGLVGVSSGNARHERVVFDETARPC